MGLALAIGTSDFKKIIQSGYYFVDKSLLIQSILEEPAEVILLPRPRRFGKTLNLSMLYYFLDGYLESGHEHLFEQLAISENKKLCAHYQNKHPVIFLTFKDIKSDNFAEAFSQIELLISELFKQFKPLLIDILSEDDKPIFNKIVDKCSPTAEFYFSLKYLTQWLFEKTGQQAIILIDEYDTPVTESHANDYYQKIIDVIRNLFGRGLKDNKFLKKAVMTGITRITKESIFSDLNHFEIYSVLDPSFPQYFGFTEGEVKQLLIDDGHPEQLDKIREWYNGYQFGGEILYNPWSILKCVKRQYLFEPYWINTSSNHLIRELIGGAKADVKASFIELLQGEAISRPVNEHIVFAHLKTTEDSLWGLLVSAGYLTVVQRPEEESMVCKVRIPNREVALLYKRMLEEWFSDPLSKDNYQHFVRSLAKGQVERFSQLLNEYLQQTGSYFDFNQHSSEKVFHTFVLGLVVGLSDEYRIQSNREAGLGRFDVLLQPKDPKGLGIVLEFKVTEQLNALENTADTALQQIKDRNYASALKQQGIHKHLFLGIAFCGQKASIASELLS